MAIVLLDSNVEQKCVARLATRVRRTVNAGRSNTRQTFGSVRAMGVPSKVVSDITITGQREKRPQDRDHAKRCLAGPNRADPSRLVR
jgi:hypothetical protein